LGREREWREGERKKEYDAWGPRLVVDMEVEMWRLTGVEKLELD
jgi:hypothetical protein